MEATLTPTVLDSKGRQILKGSIVGMTDPQGYWSSYQGLVVEPYSDMEGDGYTVAVFFDREVPESDFHYRGWLNKGLMNPTEWDRQLRPDYQKALLTTERWTLCPRIVFFRPEELVVESAWKLEHLIKRQFPTYWFSYAIAFPLIPGSHACWMKECSNLATDMALVNVWESIYPTYVCRPCFEKWNGIRLDDLPPHKEPLPGAPVKIAQAA